MRKLIKPTNGIDIDQLTDMLETGSNLIVFYRSNNDRDGIPVFLKIDDFSYYFMSPINHYKKAYEARSIRETLLNASRARQIYVLDKEEAGELFKLGPTN